MESEGLGALVNRTLARTGGQIATALARRLQRVT